jgi:hypothetical protein
VPVAVYPTWVSLFTMYTIEEIIETLVESMCADATERDKHAFREALRGLVRFAQAEQVLSIQRDFHSVDIATSPNYKRSA